MSYKVGSAKDARKDPGFTEQDFVNRFTARQPEIVAYKQQHGGDLEGAYQAVTGEAWPAGRSVKLHNGAPELTKDRTVKSVLGKYVALPAAIGATAAFAPGALPAIGHGLGFGAAGGGVAGGGLGTGALGLGATIPGAGAASGVGLGGLGLGTLGGVSGAVKTGGQIAGAIGKGRAEDRAAQNDALQGQQQSALQASMFNRQGPSLRLTNSLRGEGVANAQPVSFSGSGRDLRISGGLSPALIGPNSRALGSDISRQALLSQLGQGGASDSYTFNTQPYAPQQPNALDKLLKGAGIAGTAFDLLKGR